MTIESLAAEVRHLTTIVEHNRADIRTLGADIAKLQKGVDQTSHLREDLVQLQMRFEEYTARPQEGSESDASARCLRNLVRSELEQCHIAFIERPEHE